MAEEVPDVYVRFEGIDGECTDQMHPGKQEPGGDYPSGVKFGWFQIKSFSFSFSVKDTGDAASDKQRAAARLAHAAGGTAAPGAAPGTTPAVPQAAGHQPAAASTDT